MIRIHDAFKAEGMPESTSPVYLTVTVARIQGWMQH
jgi:hypothetical protein